MEQAKIRNAQPLPTPNNKSHGLRLPPERYCLVGNRVDLIGTPLPLLEDNAVSPPGSPILGMQALPKRRGRRRKAPAEAMDEDA